MLYFHFPYPFQTSSYIPIWNISNLNWNCNTSLSIYIIRNTKGIRLIKYEILMKGIVDIMKNKKRFFYHRLLFYILGLLIMSVGSNLFLKAALGVAPSCTMALTLSYLSPVHSYALFNFLINSTFLVCEALILHEFGKMQLTQLGLTFVYSLFIEFTSYGLFFIEPHGLAAKILLSVIACAVLSIGVGFTISSGFAVMPMEGLVKTISDKKNISFGAVRVCLEVLFTVCSAISSFVLLPELPSVGIGTVIAAFLSGNITNIFSSLFHKRINAYLGFQE